MKVREKGIVSAPTIVWAVLTLSACLGSAAEFEAYYLYLDNYPRNAHPDWTDGGTGSQGIAHDNDNWYITSQNVLWKVPVGVDLAQSVQNEPGVLREGLPASLKAE